MNSVATFFGQHLQELKQRLITSGVAVIACSLVAYYFAEQLFGFLVIPLYTAHPTLKGLVYTQLTEAFITYMKVALLVGILTSFPVLCYQIWMFVAPGLHDQEIQFARRVVFWASGLFFSGVVFTYLVALPNTLTFFMSFAGENLEPLPKLDYYLTFVIRLALGFGLAFEIPFLMVMATKAGLVTTRYFAANRWIYYGVIVVLTFLLTGGEFVATGMAAAPLFLLYEAGLLLVKILRTGKNDQDDS